MSRVKELKRQLEALSQVIEALDAELAAGRLEAEAHGRQRAEREREAGRLFVSLRRAQREARAREAERAEPPVTPVPARGWLGHPLVLAAGMVLLVGVGVGVGVTVARRSGGAPGAGTPAATPAAAPAAGPGAVMTGIELQALRQAAEREDAPLQSLLQFAHVALDQGKLDEARRAYERVLGREPKNVEAITHLGAALYAEGRVDAALAKVDEALRIDPRYIHGLWDRTQYLFVAKRDYAGAVKAAEAFLKVVPDGPDADSVKKLLAEARQKAR